MCGIFGWITPGRVIDRPRAAAAVSLMRHRGPDDEGYLFSSLGSGEASPAGGDETSMELQLPTWRGDAVMPHADAVLGFRRLAIHDLSTAGHQPMGSPDGKLWIVFNGEVYNFPELRAELEQCGSSFRSKTDTEVILRAYEQWGAGCLHRFNGMWGLAILDLRRQGEPQLFLARDRCGVKPLYYAEDGNGGIAFASEIKALRVTRDRWTTDPLQFSNFLAWGRYPSPAAGDTIFQEIRSLPPGCSALLDSTGLHVNRWWELPENGDGDASGVGDAVAKLRVLLEDAVKLRLRADVPVGSCLSGGLDSSIIVGMVNRLLTEDAAATHSGGTQHTFSAVYNIEGPFNERKFVNRVLSGINATGHFTVPDGEGLAADFDRMVWHQDEPFTTTSIFAQWCVMRLVKESGTKVLLDGQAADELFAGYRPYQWLFSTVIKERGLFAALKEMQSIRRATGDRALGHLLGSVPVALLPASLIKGAARYGYSRALRRSAGRLLRPEAAAALVDHVRDAGTPESYPWRRMVENLDQHLRGITLDFGLPHLLRFEDRNSMAFSIESRVPFTDYRLVEFAFSPAMKALKIREGWSKWALRKAGAGTVPDDIIWRRDKMGFGTPEPQLVQSLAKASGAQYIEAAISAGGVAAGGAERVLKEAMAGTAGKVDYLAAFRLMVAGSWIRQFQTP